MTDYVLEAEALADWEDDNCRIKYHNKRKVYVY